MRVQPAMFAAAAIFLACKPSLRDPNWRPQPSVKMLSWFASLNYSGYRGQTEVPIGYPTWHIQPQLVHLKLNKEAVELGRFLFYDPLLSADSSIRCASCHIQKYSFSDPRQFSEGVYGRKGRRNSMHLVNLVADRRFFWDGRAASLEEQVLMPISDAQEMDLPLGEALARLTKHPLYPDLFERAYGNREITKEKLADALAQFVRSIISYSSADDYLRAWEDRRLTWSEVPSFARKLWPLYKKSFGIMNCGPCHAVALAAGQNSFDDIGLDKNPQDMGYFVVTGNALDKGKFKIPVLRNISVTAPYMHDGRFKTLKEVIEHYRSGMHRRPNTSPQYLTQEGKFITESLTDEQVKTLTESMELNFDGKVLTEEKYSDPF
ncbi:MAG: cytochrome c peroxidase [Turneriella sp.]